MFSYPVVSGTVLRIPVVPCSALTVLPVVPCSALQLTVLPVVPCSALTVLPVFSDAAELYFL